MLYPQILRDDFARLPLVLRRFHSTPGGGRATGTVSVRHTSWFLARLCGLPPSGENMPMRLEVIATADKEIWIRHFGDAERKSVQTLENNLLLETFGPVRCLFRVLGDGEGMRFESQSARLWALRLPFRIRAIARGNDASWQFEVIIPRVGSYSGVMAPVP